MQQQHIKAPGSRGSLSMLINAICVGCKFVSTSVRRAGLADNQVLGAAGSSNVQGEDQKKLDIISNEVFKNVLIRSGQCCLLVTEEEDEPITIPEKNRGDYAVVFDPLDGSSNIDCGVSVGTIFGIYKLNKDSPTLTTDILNRPGKDMVAAGYCMYGSMSYLMITLGHGVAGFTLDPSLGEFVLTHPTVTVGKSRIYSVNEGNAANWHPAPTQFVDQCKNPADGKSGWTLRYVGSMVADVHRTLLYGGVFMYAADKKNPKGKLRMLYECYPMAMLMEQAGGKASDGKIRTLDTLPDGYHSRAPIYLGTTEYVEQIEEFYRQHA